MCSSFQGQQSGWPCTRCHCQEQWSLAVLDCTGIKVIVCKQISGMINYIFKDVTSDFKTDICQVALDLLCIPATSTDCERLFSAAGYLSQNRASSISPKNLERRCLLKTNQTIWIMIGLFNIKLLFVRNKFAWIGILFLFLASVGVYFVLIGEST